MENHKPSVITSLDMFCMRFNDYSTKYRKCSHAKIQVRKKILWECLKTERITETTKTKHAKIQENFRKKMLTLNVTDIFFTTSSANAFLSTSV